MNVLVDMNLSPAWVGFLAQHGFEAVHWSSVGDPRARDAPVMEWARQHNCVVFTHDHDFSALMAHTGLGAPSVLQVRTHDVLPAAIGDVILGLCGNIAKHWSKLCQALGTSRPEAVFGQELPTARSSRRPEKVAIATARLGLGRLDRGRPRLSGNVGPLS